MNNNLEDRVCKAINIIAKRIVDKANYDKVVKGEVFIEDRNGENFYRVKVGKVFYPAAAVGREEYFPGDIVFLLIPQNDTNNTKFILGREGDFKIRKFPKGEGGIEVDDFLSLVSENPVQNKVIKKYIDETFALKKYYQNDRIRLTDNPLVEVGEYSVIIGDNSAASMNSMSIGNNNSTNGDYSFIHGKNNFLNSICSFISGEQNSIEGNLTDAFILGGKKNNISYEDDQIQAYAESIINSVHSEILNSGAETSIVNSEKCSIDESFPFGLVINSKDSKLTSSGTNSFIFNSLNSEIKNTGTRFCIINSAGSSVENVTTPHGGDLFTLLNCNGLVLKNVSQNNTLIGINGMNSQLITDTGTNVSALGSQSIDLTRCGKNASLLNVDNCSITNTNSSLANFRTIIGSASSSIINKNYSMILNSSQCSISGEGNFNTIINSQSFCSISGDGSIGNTIISSTNDNSINGSNNGIYSTDSSNITGNYNAIFNSQSGVYVTNSNSCIVLGGEYHNIQNSNYCLVNGTSNNISSTNYSVFMGRGLLSSGGSNKIILGKYNESVNNEIFVIGAGENGSNRKNVLDIHAEYINDNFDTFILNGKELKAQFKTIKTNDLINNNDDIITPMIEQEVIDIDINKDDSNLVYLNSSNETTIKIKIAEHLIPELTDDEWNYENYLYLPELINFDLLKIELTSSNCFTVDGNNKKKKCYNSTCVWISEDSVMSGNDETVTYYLELVIPTERLYNDLGLIDIEGIKIQVKGYII